MTPLGIFQILLFLGVLLALTKPIGAFMARVYEGQKTFLHPILQPLERLLYRLGGVKEDVEQRWTQYAASMSWDFRVAANSWAAVRVMRNLRVAY